MTYKSSFACVFELNASVRGH